MFENWSLIDLDQLVSAASIHFARLISAVAIFPAFGPTGPFRLHRIGLAAILTFLVMSIRGQKSLEVPDMDAVTYSLLIAREVTLGMLIGWVAGFVFDATRIAGSLLATEMGLNIANQIDPVSRASIPMLSHFFQSIAFVVFFASDGHGDVLRSLVSSYETLPPGTFTPDLAVAEALMEATGGLMLASLRIAGPAFILMVLLTVLVSLLSKVAPSLNILDASYPVRILGALTVLVIFLPTMMRAFDTMLQDSGLTLSRVLARG